MTDFGSLLHTLELARQLFRTVRHPLHDPSWPVIRDRLWHWYRMTGHDQPCEADRQEIARFLGVEYKPR